LRGGGEGGVDRSGELPTTNEDQLQRLGIVDEDQAGGMTALGGASQSASRYRATVANRRGPPVSSVFPQILPCFAPACPRRQNSRRRVGHPSSARTTSMSTCTPTVVSHHITSSCHEASCRRCPPAAALVAAAPVGFRSQPLGDEVLSRLPRVAPSHPLAAGRRLWVIQSPHFRCAVAFSAAPLCRRFMAEMPAPGARQRCLAQRLCFLFPC
jgi:hypothetical protein